MAPPMCPSVSVIMPAFNAAPFLAAAVESVLSQTFGDLELLIVDDGSRDRTLAVAEEYARSDTRVQVLSQANSGQSVARNRALGAARGEFIALLDSDDEWMPEYLMDALAAFEAAPDVAVVTSNVLNRGGVLDAQPYYPIAAGDRRLTLLDMIEREDAVCIMSLFRRQVYERIGGFNEGLRTNEDYDFWLRAAFVGFKFLQTAKPRGFYRRRLNSMSANELQMLSGIVEVLTNLRDRCVSRPVERRAIERQIQRFECLRLDRIAKTALREGDFGKAAVHFRLLRARRGGWALLTLAGCYAPRPLSWLDRTSRTVRALPDALKMRQ